MTVNPFASLKEPTLQEIGHAAKEEYFFRNKKGWDLIRDTPFKEGDQVRYEWTTDPAYGGTARSFDGVITKFSNHQVYIERMENGKANEFCFGIGALVTPSGVPSGKLTKLAPKTNPFAALPKNPFANLG